MTSSSTDDGDQYRLMVLNALALNNGSKNGAFLACVYTYSIKNYEFYMWTGSHPVGPTLHTLLAPETSQERLNSHWLGYLENIAAVTAS